MFSACPAFNMRSSRLGDLTHFERDQLYTWETANLANKYCGRDQQGHKVESLTSSLTLGKYGPALLMDTGFLKSTQAFNRSELPLRSFHGKGIGAHGFFQVTKDITKFSKAKVFKPFKRVPIFCRMSSADFTGQADTENINGHTMSFRFYTEDGLLDFLCIQLPVFDVRDALGFMHSISRARFPNPQTGRNRDYTAEFDFSLSRTERFNFLTRMYSDHGIPKGFRYMNAFPVNIFVLQNAEGETTLARFQFKTSQGEKYLTRKQAERLALTNPNYQLNDIYEAISSGNYPSYALTFQTMNAQQKKQYESETGFDVFDVSKEWPESKFPFETIGEVILNRLPGNHSAETEQVAFTPGNLVPGIVAAPEDRLFLGRVFAYSDTQVYRVGPNFSLLPINRSKGSKTPPRTYIRDGSMNGEGVQGGAPAYYPNSFGGPEVMKNSQSFAAVDIPIGPVAQKDASDDKTHFVQVTEFLNSISRNEYKRTAQNLALALRKCEPFIQEKMINMFCDNVDLEFGKLMEKYINSDNRDFSDDEEENDEEINSN